MSGGAQKVAVEVGARLRATREMFNVSQVNVGTALNVGGPTISRYEAGTREMDHDMLIRFALHFGVTTDWLLLGDTSLLHSLVRSKVEHSYPVLVQMRPKLAPRLLSAP